MFPKKQDSHEILIFRPTDKIALAMHLHSGTCEFGRNALKLQSNTQSTTQLYTIFWFGEILFSLNAVSIYTTTVFLCKI